MKTSAIKEVPKDTFKNTDILDVKVEGIGYCWVDNKVTGKWSVDK